MRCNNETCELQFEGCPLTTPVMFHMAGLNGRLASGKSHVLACSTCWRAMVGNAKPEPPAKNATRLPSVAQKAVGSK